MTKHTMTQAAAIRIAHDLLLDEDGAFRVCPSIDSEQWRNALQREGFNGLTARHARDVINTLCYAEKDALANRLESASFDALIREVMDLREAANDLIESFGKLARARL